MGLCTWFTTAEKAKCQSKILTVPPCSSRAETQPTAVPVLWGVFLCLHQCHSGLRHRGTVHMFVEPSQSFLHRQIDIAPHYRTPRRESKLVSEYAMSLIVLFAAAYHDWILTVRSVY